MVDLRNYEIKRCDRADKKGGGVAVYHKHSLNIRELSKPLISDSHMNFEYLAIDLTTSNTCITFICFYIPPDSSKCSSTINNVCKIISFFLKTPKPVVLLGDFNLPKISWNSCTVDSSQSSELFLNCCIEHGLTQCINSPTRDHNILDLVLCNPSAISHLITSTVDCPLTYNCDHNLISLTLSLGTYQPKTLPLSSLNFKAANYDLINNKLLHDNWNLPSNTENFQENYDVFLTTLNSSINQYVPKYKNYSKNHQRGRPQHLKTLLKKKLQVYRQMQAGKLTKQDYRAAARNYEKAVNNWHDKVEKNVCESPNKNKFYAYANRKLKNNFSIPPLTDAAGSTITSDTDKAMLLNNTFHASFVTDDKSNFSPVLKNSPPMPFFIISNTDVLNAISKSKDKLSITPEGIPLYFIKRVAKSIVTQLVFLFNNFIRTGFVPTQWKHSIITPIFKKGDRRTPTNYRPIALTSAFCRILESIISKKILDHLLFNDLILANQYGFLPNRSSTHQLLYCLDKWYTSFFTEQINYITYTDIRKAFDTVSHTKLGLVLESYGINLELLQWISNFLSNRNQVVRIQSSFSSSLPILSGVPQGSVLGPLLFIIFINDIILSVKSQHSADFALFADDAKFFSTDPRELQLSLNAFTNATKAYQLSLAPEKCFILPIGKSKLQNSLVTFSVDSFNLPNKSSAQDLGVVIASDLKWEKHISKVYRQASFRSYQIIKCFRTKNIWTYISLYKSYVCPILEYQSQIWSTYLLKDNDKLETIQIRFTKLICRRCNIPFNSYQDRLYKLNILSLKHRRIRSDLIFLYKIINNQSPLSFDSFFQYQDKPYTFRNKTRKILPKHDFKSGLWRGSFFERACKYWNGLNSDVSSAKSLFSFKLKLKSVSYDGLLS